MCFPSVFGRQFFFFIVLASKVWGEHDGERYIHVCMGQLDGEKARWSLFCLSLIVCRFKHYTY